MISSTTCLSPNASPAPVLSATTVACDSTSASLIAARGHVGREQRRENHDKKREDGRHEAEHQRLSRDGEIPEGLQRLQPLGFLELDVERQAEADDQREHRGDIPASTAAPACSRSSSRRCPQWPLAPRRSRPMRPACACLRSARPRRARGALRAPFPAGRERRRSCR